MAYTETTRTGYGSRLVNSLKGIVIGIILFCGATAALWWNEGNYVKTEAVLAEARDTVEELENVNTRLRSSHSASTFSFPRVRNLRKSISSLANLNDPFARMERLTRSRIPSSEVIFFFISSRCLANRFETYRTL